jgi:hypothetical protein
MSLLTPDLRAALRSTGELVNRWEIIAVKILTPPGKTTIEIESQAVKVDRTGTRRLPIALDTSTLDTPESQQPMIADAVRRVAASLAATLLPEVASALTKALDVPDAVLGAMGYQGIRDACYAQKQREGVFPMDATHETEEPVEKPVEPPAFVIVGRAEPGSPMQAWGSVGPLPWALVADLKPLVVGRAVERIADFSKEADEAEAIRS